MEIEHARIDNTRMTVQLIRSSCPMCRESVRFILPEKDRIYREDAEYYKKMCYKASEEIHRLEKIIDALSERG